MIGEKPLDISAAQDKRFKVYQHWDTLKTCVVGRSYPPEFYSFLTNARIRNIFEKLAEETEEDFQSLIIKLESFGVEVWRPNISPKFDQFDDSRQQYREPPMTPRDDHVMIGTRFFKKDRRCWQNFYDNVKDVAWPQSPGSIRDLPEDIQKECREVFGWGSASTNTDDPYYYIMQKIAAQGNQISLAPHDCINGASVARLGQDLVIGTETKLDQTASNNLCREFADYNLHLVVSDGHFDGAYCPVCPGLLITHRDAEIYQSTFKDWEVLRMDPTLESKPRWHRHKNLTRGRWWLPGFESDSLLIEVIETYLIQFVGFVEETCFEVNMLMIDSKNAIAFSYNSLLEKTLQRYGIALHIVPFRHRYFWDGGAHCVTCDIDRAGALQKILSDRLC